MWGEEGYTERPKKSEVPQAPSQWFPAGLHWGLGVPGSPVFAILCTHMLWTAMRFSLGRSAEDGNACRTHLTEGDVIAVGTARQIFL